MFRRILSLFLSRRNHSVDSYSVCVPLVTAISPLAYCPGPQPNAELQQKGKEGGLP